MQHSSYELGFLLHSFGKLGGFLVLPFLKLDSFQPEIDSLIQSVSVYAFECGEELNLLANFHLLVQPAFFWQVTNAILQLGCNLFAKQFNAPRIRRSDIHDHSDGSRLAGAVRPEKSIDPSGINGQTKVTNR